jgi:hypothetical protein
MQYQLSELHHERRANHYACLNTTVSSHHIDSQGSHETASTPKSNLEKERNIREQKILLWLAGTK